MGCSLSAVLLLGTPRQSVALSSPARGQPGPQRDRPPEEALGGDRSSWASPHSCHPPCSAPGAPRDERTERGEGRAGRCQRGIQRKGECPAGQAGVGGLAAAAWVPELTCGRLLSSLVALGHADPRAHKHTCADTHAHTRAKATGQCPGVVFSEGLVGRVGSGVGASGPWGSRSDRLHTVVTAASGAEGSVKSPGEALSSPLPETVPSRRRTRL